MRKKGVRRALQNLTRAAATRTRRLILPSGRHRRCACAMLTCESCERRHPFARRGRPRRIGDVGGDARRHRRDARACGLQGLADGALRALGMMLIRCIRKCAMSGVIWAGMATIRTLIDRVIVMDMSEMDRLALRRRNGDWRHRLNEQRKYGEGRRDSARPDQSPALCRYCHAAARGAAHPSSLAAAADGARRVTRIEKARRGGGPFLIDLRYCCRRGSPGGMPRCSRRSSIRWRMRSRMAIPRAPGEGIRRS